MGQCLSVLSANSCFSVSYQSFQKYSSCLRRGHRLYFGQWKFCEDYRYTGHSVCENTNLLVQSNTASNITEKHFLERENTVDGEMMFLAHFKC